MTLKQRRRHGELMGMLDKMKSDPFLKLTDSYTPGADPEEDLKREASIKKFKALVEEIHQIEEAARTGD